MIEDRLKQWEYCKSKFPMYMQQSYGILSHFEMLHEFLLEMDDTEDCIFEGLNVFEKKDTDFLKSDESDILDKLATLFGVARTFDLSYTYMNKAYKKSLHLTNEELLNLIKARVMRNNYDGTYKMSRELYEMLGLNVYLTNSGPANVQVVLDESENTTLSDNMTDMFKAGLFTLNSAGIAYSNVLLNLKKVLTWVLDSNKTDVTDNYKWDKGVWGL